MNFSPETILFGIVALVVILGSLSMSCHHVLPYSAAQPYSSYEAMTNYQESEVAMDNTLVSTAPGMEGIYESPDTNHVLDMFASSIGDIKCTNQSNMSTQSGFLCLSPDQVKALQSRGGNA